MNVTDVQDFLKELKIDGWLLTDFQMLNPPAFQILGLDLDTHRSRRWFYFIPKVGAPVKVVHAIESGALDGIPGRVESYYGRRHMIETLAEVLKDAATVAMEYSPECRLPTVSRVDAGTVELVRACGPRVVSSGDLLQIFTSRWSRTARESHHTAANVLRDTVEDVWGLIGERLHSGTLTERDVQMFMMERFAKNSCRTNHPPIVAAGDHSADPHYSPPPMGSRVIEPDQLILIDLWCKANRPDSVYADITWTAWTGDTPPDEIVEVFTIVRDARDLAVRSVQDAFAAKKKITGADVDRITRSYITEYGYGELFTHRTGHSLDGDVHGAGANLDSFESEDERLLLPGTGFTIEPGIYIPGEFGIRSELNVVIHNDGTVNISGLPVQEDLVLI